MKNITTSIFYKILIPTILTNMVTSVASVADTIIVGNYLGEVALSALTFNSPVYMFINTMAAMIAIGGAISMSINVGKGEKDAANNIFSVAISWALLIGIIAAIVGVVAIDTMVIALGASGEVSIYVKEYAIIIFATIPIFLLNIVLAFFARNDGRAKLAMIGMLTAIGVNVILDILLVGFTTMGVKGAAWATVISTLTSLLIIGSHFFSKKCTITFAFSLKIKTFANIIKSGISTSLTFIYLMISAIVLNHLIMTIAGQEGMIIYSVVFNITLISMTIFEGISQTIQPIVSVYHGERNEAPIKATMYLATKTGILLCASVVLLLELFPSIFPRIFGIKDIESIKGSIVAIRTIAPAIFFMTANVLLSYYYQSREYRLLPFITIINRNLLMLISGMFLCSMLFGFDGIWFGYLFAEIITLFIVWFITIFMRKQDKTKQTILLLCPVLNSFERDLLANKTEAHNLINDLKVFFLAYPAIEDISKKALLSIDELITNIVMYGSINKNTPVMIQARVVIEDDNCISITIRDTGKNFDPTLYEKSDKKSTDVGGLGIFLIKKMANYFEYIPTLGFNRTVLKYIAPKKNKMEET